MFASLLDSTHLHICLQSNVRVLPWDFCKINMWTVTSPSKGELLDWFVNTVLLHRVRSWANGQMHFEEAKQITANALAPKTRQQHSKKLVQISLVKLTGELFSCGSSLVEMQHMLSISMMWWMQLAQKCKPRETHGWFYRRCNTVSSQTDSLIFNPPPSFQILFKKRPNCLLVSCISPYP